MGAEEHSREVKVTNAYGIHARPAALIVKEAAQYNAEITLEKRVTWSLVRVLWV